MSAKYRYRRQARKMKRKSIDVTVVRLSLSRKRLSFNVTKKISNNERNLSKSKSWLKEKLRMTWTMSKSMRSCWRRRISTRAMNRKETHYKVSFY